MANADIIQRLRQICDGWPGERPDVPWLYHALGGHLSSLEGPGPWREAPDFCGRIMTAWWGVDPINADMPADLPAVNQVVAELRAWLDAVGGSGGESGDTPDPPI